MAATETYNGPCADLLAADVATAINGYSLPCSDLLVAEVVSGCYSKLFNVPCATVEGVEQVMKTPGKCIL